MVFLLQNRKKLETGVRSFTKDRRCFNENQPEDTSITISVNRYCVIVCDSEYMLIWYVKSAIILT